MSVVADIIQSYRQPRKVMDRHLQGGIREDRAFVFLAIACALIFVSQWPALSRAAHLDPSVPLDARLGGALLAWMFIAPLGFYALSFVFHLLARGFKGQGPSFQSRMALFWTLLVVSPIWLLYGLVAGFIGPGPQMNSIGILLLIGFFWVWINSMIEAYWPRN